MRICGSTWPLLLEPAGAARMPPIAEPPIARKSDSFVWLNSR